MGFKERSTEEFFVIITRDCDPKVRRCQNVGANAKIGAPHAYDRDSFLTVIQSLNPLNKAHVGLMVHELLHVLGMVHTQTRKDTDQYIEVYDRNIARGYWFNYMKCDDCEAHGIPYDCMSIMHYRNGLLAKWPWLPTMKALYSDCDLWSANNEMTKADVDLLKKLYCSNSDAQGCCSRVKIEARGRYARTHWGQYVGIYTKLKEGHYKKGQYELKLVEDDTETIQWKLTGVEGVFQKTGLFAGPCLTDYKRWHRRNANGEEWPLGNLQTTCVQ